MNFIKTATLLLSLASLSGAVSAKTPLKSPAIYSCPTGNDVKWEGASFPGWKGTAAFPIPADVKITIALAGGIQCDYSGGGFQGKFLLPLPPEISSCQVNPDKTSVSCH